MSGIVDMWTSELAKLKNKEEAVLSSGGSAPPSPPPVDGGSLWWPTALAQALRVEKLPALHCSETSLSMLLDTISA